MVTEKTLSKGAGDVPREILRSQKRVLEPLELELQLLFTLIKKKRIYLFLFCVYGCLGCVMPCACSAHRTQKRAPDPTETEVTVLSCYMGTGN